MPRSATFATAHFTQLRPRLVAFARLQLRDVTAAEDAVQEALLTAFEKNATFEGRSEFETWVILHRARLRLRECLDHGWLN